MLRGQLACIAAFFQYSNQCCGLICMTLPRRLFGLLAVQTSCRQPVLTYMRVDFQFSKPVLNKHG